MRPELATEEAVTHADGGDHARREALLGGVGVPDEMTRRITADRREAESAKALSA